MKRKIKPPPRLAAWLLNRMSRYEDEFLITGDIEEEFREIAREKGMFQAKFWYWNQAIKSIPSYYKYISMWGMIMIKNYLKVAVRDIKKNKVHTFINISGLSISMAGCLLSLMFIANELSYENFHHNRDRICRVGVNFGEKDSKIKLPGAMSALAPALIENVPEVEDAVRFVRDGNAKVEYNQRTFNERNFFITDSTVFDMFSFVLIKGNENDVLSEPFSAVITQKTAAKYFGSQDPVGKTILYNDKYPLRITGVIKDIPPNTHLKCDLLVSFSSNFSENDYQKNAWIPFGNCYTYVLLNPKTSLENLQAKMSDLLRENTNESFAERIEFSIRSLKDIHLKSDTIVDLEPRGSSAYVYLFLLISILVLFIACFNFMNLSTARSLQRLKEVGIRKVIGAHSAQLIRQFLTESLFIVLLSLFIGIALFILLYPQLLSFLNTSLSINQQNFSYIFWIIPSIIIIVGFFAGSYPALFLSRFSPVSAIKNITPQGSFRTINRKILVLSQFTISILLIIGTLVVLKQFYFMINSNLGFDKENVVILQYPRSEENAFQKYNLLKEQLKQNPAITAISGAYSIPGINSKSQMIVSLTDGSIESETSFQANAVDFDFVDVLGIRIVSGRNFSKEFSLDESESVLLNQTAVSQLQFTNPIGKKLRIPGNERSKEVTVVGVFKDFHIRSLKENIEPLLLHSGSQSFSVITVRISPENINSSLTFLEDVWERVFPNSPFEYSFLSERYKNLYHSESTLISMFSIFTALAIIFASLGLFGLTSFTVGQRIKEIGIRKVLGARDSTIFLLLSKDFLKLIAYANLISWPIAYFAMNRWLMNYAYRIHINWVIFVISGASALLTAVIAIGVPAIQAVRANPVDSLRDE